MPDTSEFSEAKRALLEKYLKGNLQPTTTILDTGTQDIKTEKPNERARVVQVQSGGSKRPFFFLHGSWKGTPFFCIPLARELGVDRPFYALEAYDFDGLSIPPTVVTMAAAHIKAMRAIQPEGPYLLGGWCNGGLIAYEMACQLHAAGQTLDLLVLMDPMYLGYYSPRRLIRIAVSQLGNLTGLVAEKQVDWFLRLLHMSDPLLNVYCRLLNVHHERSHDSIRLIFSDTTSFAWQKVVSIIKKYVRKVEREMASPLHLELDALTPQAHSRDYPGIVEWIDMGYRPFSPYCGKITFFWPSEEPWHIASGGWLHIAEAKDAQDIETYVIPGNQETWRSEHLHALAGQLRACLNEVQSVGSVQ